MTGKHCPGCDQVLPLDRFSKRRPTSQRAGKHLSRCMTCQVRNKVKHEDVIGYVPAPRVWYIFDEIARRVGQSVGASGVGMSANQFRSILYKRTLRVQRRNVRRAIVFLRSLRERRVWDPPRVGRPLKHSPYCRECGGDLYSTTFGCSTCLNRVYRRKWRAAHA